MNIIIIGCGNIGFRHLESILNLDAKKNIYIVDFSKCIDCVVDSVSSQIWF